MLYSIKILLCPLLFNWVKFWTTKGVIKLHSVLDHDMGLFNYAVMTEGNQLAVKVSRRTAFPSGSVVVTERAYVNY